MPLRVDDNHSLFVSPVLSPRDGREDLRELFIWAVREGLRGASAYDLFDGYCQRLVIHGVSLWRAHAAMETLHPQWAGYGYIWRRDLNAIQPEQYARDDLSGPRWQTSSMYDLVRRAREGEDDPTMRRRLEAGPEQRDFPALDEYFAEGATDYFAQLFTFGERGDRAHGTGIVYSFATDRRGGFDDDDTTFLQATLPGLSLAMKADAGYVIASALLRTYLGEETGRRVHAGAIERGSVESIHAVLWYADIRGFTHTDDSAVIRVAVIGAPAATTRNTDHVPVQCSPNGVRSVPAIVPPARSGLRGDFVPDFIGSAA